MSFRSFVFLFLFIFGFGLELASASVVVSIKPLHSLVSGVMGDTGEAKLIVGGNVSPHGFHLKPSQLRAMRESDIVFYIDDNFETFLVGALEVLPEHVKPVSVSQESSLTLFPFRDGGAWESHDAHHDEHHEEEEHHDEQHEEEEHHDEHHEEEEHHDEHHEEEEHHDEHHEEEEHHDEHHEEEEHHDEQHEEEEHHDEHHEEDEHHDEHHEEDEHHDENAHHDEHDEHGFNDMHIWLDANNASLIVDLIAKELSIIYPENRAIYEANSRAYIARIEALDSELESLLLDVRDEPFIVFHDAYQYFERAYGLRGVGSITVESDDFASASRIRDMREKLHEEDVKCVFREPQFSDRLVRTVIEDTSVKSATLDPLGSHLETGEALYFELMRKLAYDLKHCLES